MPRARSMSAVVKPPVPPPTIIAFIAHTPLDARRPPASHGPSFGRKRLCRLRFQLRPGLRLSLNFEVLEILPVAHAVAENLFFSGQILRRTKYVRTIPRRGLHSERGIDQMRAAECNEIGAAGGEDGIDLVS